MFKRLEKDVSHVSKLPNTPTLENGYTPSVLKERFDMAGEDIKEYINESLLRELESVHGASSVGIEEDDSVSGKNVQEGLRSLGKKIQEAVGGQIPDGTIAPDKFVPSVASFLTEGSLKMRLFAEPGDHTFIPSRTGDYKITVQGAGGGGSVVGIYYNSYGGGSGAVCVGILRLESGHEYTVRVGRGGNGITVDEKGHLLAKAESGEACGFYDGDSELLFAEGGKTGDHSGGEAISRGGIIRKTGGYPVLRFKKYTSTPSLEVGAGSDFASVTALYETPAGLGAGGYGAEFDVSGEKYSRVGGKGGNGCVLIEWVE